MKKTIKQGLLIPPLVDGACIGETPAFLRKTYGNGCNILDSEVN